MLDVLVYAYLMIKIYRSERTMDDQRRRQLTILRARLLEAEARGEEDLAMSDEVQVTVGADIGNATSVLAVAVGGRVTIVKMPTAKAMGARLPATLAKDEPVITRDRGGVPVPVALGMAALRYADEPSPARGHSDRYGAWTLDFVLAGVAQVVRAPRVAMRLATCVPAELHGQVGRDVVAAMRRAHPTTYQGREPQTIAARSVRVVREGEAAVAALGPREGRGILIDGGGGTTHVALTRDGRVIDVVTRNLGVQRALDAAEPVIRGRIGRRLSMLERHELEQALAARQPYAVRASGAGVRVDDVARAFLDEFADTLINDIKTIAPFWRGAHSIDLCGGIAHLLPDAFTAGFAGVTVAVAPRPEELNARGALVMAGATEVQDAVAA